MWMPGEALVAPGPRVTKADAGAAGGLADRLRHHRRAALLPADRERDLAIVKGVERREVALARHAEHMLHAVGDQLVDQNLAARPGAVIGAHGFSAFGQRLIGRTWPGSSARSSAREVAGFAEPADKSSIPDRPAWRRDGASVGASS